MGSASRIFPTHNDDDRQIDFNYHTPGVQVGRHQIAGHGEKWHVIAAPVFMSNHGKIAEHCVELNWTFDENATDLTVSDLTNPELTL